jgi:hypothetical protein
MGLLSGNKKMRQGPGPWQGVSHDFTRPPAAGNGHVRERGFPVPRGLKRLPTFSQEGGDIGSQLELERPVLLNVSEIVSREAHQIDWSDRRPQSPLPFGGSPAMLFRKKRTISLRERFLVEQQLQLMEDSKLTDPAEAYRSLVEELDDESELEPVETSDAA